MNDQEKPKRKDHPNSGEKVHIIFDQFIQYLYSLAIVQQILYMYNGVKYSSKNVEKTLDRVEEGFKVAYIHSLDLYNRYRQTNMNGIFSSFFFLNLTILIAIITMLFNAILNGKEALEHASKTTSNAQATARQMVTDLSEKVQQISRASTEKAEEQANRILDGANRVAHLTMGISDESDDIEKTPWSRFQDLSHRILENSKSRVEGLYWTQFDAQSIVECLRNSISLADMVRKNKSWVAGKVGELWTSLDELKVSLEMEGERLKKNPEEMLMRYLQRTSSILPERLRILEETTGKVLNEQATSKLVALISYIEKLNEKLMEADNVHELKDEVLKEAHDRLVDLLQWLTDHIDFSDSTHTENLESVNDGSTN
ncbi:unnamed protein product [Brugia timori]|uniref:Uncharacterized protein n=1 Tax=Brugia timori TaxID=42155 RepID=A0A0R3R3Z0_9BILA|nr:unnamed protein product [Brugia timori]